MGRAGARLRLAGSPQQLLRRWCWHLLSLWSACYQLWLLPKEVAAVNGGSQQSCWRDGVTLLQGFMHKSCGKCAAPVTVYHHLLYHVVQIHIATEDPTRPDVVYRKITNDGRSEWKLNGEPHV